MQLFDAEKNERLVCEQVSSTLRGLKPLSQSGDKDNRVVSFPADVMRDQLVAYHTEGVRSSLAQMDEGIAELRDVIAREERRRSLVARPNAALPGDDSVAGLEQLVKALDFIVTRLENEHETAGNLRSAEPKAPEAQDAGKVLPLPDDVTRARRIQLAKEHARRVSELIEKASTRIPHNQSALPPTPRLTRAQTQILAGVCEGLTDKAIAAKTYRAVQTVKDHLTVLRRITNTSNRASLAVYAVRNGLA